jgi:FAS-associated factor 2
LPGSNRATSQPRQDSRASANRFLREFEKSYGENHVEFSQEGYTQTLEQARRNLQFFLVVLQSDEHDDTDHFCQNTLTNQDLMSFIRSKNIIVWGGNVGQTEAYQGRNE